ncbi:MAG: hypothetical protein KIT84_18640 [Labilithrix sp.]|nr:hypothetical protein [Labilithrix sp.]MCW5813052.1 hypothetical protein [Labilithrix sp.]
MSEDAKSDFMAAEEIKKILHGRQKAEQERIVRWVSESLELAGAAVKPKVEHAHPGVHVPATLADTPSRPRDGEAGPKDFRSFFQEKQPKNDVQFVAVAAYYHRFMAPAADRKEAISSADLQDAARLAPWTVFAKPSKTLGNAVRQGYMNGSGRGTYRLNAVGENLVSMTLPGTATTGSTKGGRGKRRPSKKAGAKKSRKSGKG